MSLAKFLFIAAEEDDKNLNIDDEQAFLQHILERVNWERDLHFYTKTSIDTLDYSGEGLNTGSKVVVAAAGESIRTLVQGFDPETPLPKGITNVKFVAPGILAVSCTAFESYDQAQIEMVDWANSLKEYLGKRLTLSL